MAGIGPTGAEREPPQPTWPGRTGSLGYLAKMFPRISETFILKEVLALRASGLPVKIYSLLPPTRDTLIHPEARALLADVCFLPQPGLRYFRGFIRDYWSCLHRRPGATMRITARTLLRPSAHSFRRFSRAIALAALIRRDRIAHLHAAWAHTPASVARTACRLTGIPWSMASHAKDIHLSKRSSLAKKLATARYTLTCTRANLDLLGAIANSGEPSVPPPEIALYHHGVNTTYFSPADTGAQPASCDVPLILSVGRLVPKKGFDVLIQSAAVLARRGVPFRMQIIGEGAGREALREQIRDSGLEDRVELRGMLVHEEVRAAYRQAICMALAARVAPNGDRDGIPNTLAEAMACGLPVVATRAGSIPELVEDGETGLLIEPDDPEALVGALHKVLRDGALRERLGRNARQRVWRQFDAAACEARICSRLARSTAIEKVLYVSADRGVPAGGAKGASIHLRAVLNALVGHGVSCRLLTTEPGPEGTRPPGVPLVVSGVQSRGKQRVARVAAYLRGGKPLERAMLRLLDNFSMYREGLRQGRAWHPDMIYERYSLTAVAGSLLARRLGIPHIIEVNAPLVEEERRFRALRWRGIARAAEGWVLRRASKVVVVSKSLAGFAHDLGVPEERIIFLPNAVDPAHFHPGLDGAAVRRRLALDNNFVIGFSGTLKPWHGVGNLLQALASENLKVPAAKVLILGDGPERDALENLSRALRIEDRVIFAGNVPHPDVGRHLAACDALAAPYDALENHWFSPLKVREYLAVGRPVIASAVGQIAESMGEGCGVVLVPPGDVSALAGAINDLATTPARRTVLGNAAAQTASWTWSELTLRLLTECERARREIWRWDDA